MLKLLLLFLVFLYGLVILVFILIFLEFFWGLSLLVLVLSLDLGVFDLFWDLWLWDLGVKMSVSFFLLVDWRSMRVLIMLLDFVFVLLIVLREWCVCCDFLDCFIYFMIVCWLLFDIYVVLMFLVLFLLFEVLFVIWWVVFCEFKDFDFLFFCFWSGILIDDGVSGGGSWGVGFFCWKLVWFFCVCGLLFCLFVLFFLVGGWIFCYLCFGWYFMCLNNVF